MSPANDSRVRDLVKRYQDEDGTESTAAFDFLVDMPKFYSTCWSMSGWGSEKKLMFWTMFLVAICLMARASDMTQFCPNVDDIVLPPKHLWDVSGHPLWIDIGLW